MEGLQTTRVIVVDDEADEAMGFMTALAQRGIGSIRYSGELAEIPQEQLNGIRLAALDMNLQQTATNAETATSEVVSLLERLISANNGPYLAIAWTNNEQYVEEFRKRSATLPCPPIMVIPMLKSDVKKGDGSWDPAKILEKLETAIDESYPLRLVGHWEQMVHQSTRDIVGEVPAGQNWVDRSGKIFATLVQAASKDASPDEFILSALFEALNSLQNDSIESETTKLSPELGTKLIQPLAGVNVTNPERRQLAGELNWKLLFGEPLHGAAPGNIYEPSACPNVAQGVFPTVDKLAEEMVDPQKLDGFQVSDCTALIMEITLLCDYQQRSLPRARFICGIAVPEADHERFKGADFIRKSPTVAFENALFTGRFKILWHSRHIVTVPTEELEDGKALFRLRHPVLLDVQSWAASHSARPGFLSIG